MANKTDIDTLNAELQDEEPKAILARIYSLYPGAAISFSGAEDVVLIDMASKLTDKPRVMTIDTGRLHPQTYRYIEKVREHYDLELELLYPEQASVARLVQSKGLFSFYVDGHEECCHLRKVAPLQRKLAGEDAWITGQRRDQSPSRTAVPVAQIDASLSTADHSIVKFNPLANWSSAQVWSYIRLLEVPYNELHDAGFISIGCEPCTRAIGPNQHEREGRWWWEEETIKECGLHWQKPSDAQAD